MTAIPPLEETVSRRVQYLRVFILGFSAFIFNTTEFVPVGLLTDIAESFAIAPAQVGWMLTIYAWIVALMSLPMMLLTRNMERKTLLLALFTLFIVSHLLTVFAWNYGALLVSRIGIAFAHAVFWSITASIAIRVAPPGKETFALSVLATGTGLAMVLGVPAGRIIGQLLGWRATFAVITLVALVVAVILLSLLPKLPSLFSGSLSKVPEVFRNRILLGMYLFIFVIFSAHYTAYSYIEPFLQQVGAVSEHFTTLILLLFGVAGIGGSILFSQFGDRANTLMLVISAVMASVCMLALYFVAQHANGLIFTILLWGAAMMIIGLSMQIKVLSVDSSAADIIMSLYSGIINLGIGAGALLGGQAILLIGLPSVGFSGAFLGALALVILVLLLKAIQVRQVSLNGH
ncbi:sugar transporter [Marinomonas sp. THO17]|uniref:sugar transporter n=1 Tax=Marinomonas sp. THO17 TaxID=3149048 RepID=UPI00336BC62C